MFHIGVGGFHRAHQAVYLDDLLHRPGHEDWGYCGIGLLGQDAGMRDAMCSQDCLYSVIERSPGIDRARVVGSIVEYLYAPGATAAVLNRLASKECRIVSLTITEGGYYVHEGSGEFNGSHPDILHDLHHPQHPRCSFGYLLEALDRRRNSGLPPFTMLSCDNLQHNGDLLRSMLLAFAERRDAGLHRWISDHASFPNSMVDRIVPVTTEQHRAVVREGFGIEDAWPVATEPFRQWVVEDRFPGGRPAWEEVGVLMTANVSAYEKMKMRLLNGSHQALCYIGMLLGYDTAHEAIGDHRIRRLVKSLMDEEVSPLLSTPAGIDLERYKATLLERFANPAIGDQLARIGTDGSVRVASFVLPSIREQLERGGPIDCLAFTVAAWFYFWVIAVRKGDGTRPPDPLGPVLTEAALQSASSPRAFLQRYELFDDALSDSTRFTGRVAHFFSGFHQEGAEVTLVRLVES
jgi:mannitol 2-dehydrogenase